MENVKNNVFMKLNIKIHRIYGKIQSSIMTFGVNKGYFIGIAFGGISVFKIAGEGSFDDWTNLSFDINTLWFLGATFASTVATTISSMINYKHSSYSYGIIKDEFYKNKVLGNLILNERQISSGYEIRTFYNGVSDEKYIISEKINSKLIKTQKNNEFLGLVNLNYKFQLADELKKYVPILLKRNFEKDKLIFNGKLLRMANDLYLDSKSVDVQSVRYFEGQCTNEIVYRKIKSNCSLDSIFLGERLLKDSDNEVLDLENSLCANYIGASTLAITRDNYIVIGKQGNFSRANAGRYAPSGSGSVVYKDIKGESSFNSVIIKAMEREFCEENNYVLEDCNKIRTVIIGYVRLLERGGKPDFFGVSFLDEDAYNLRNDIKKTELGIQDENLMLKVEQGSSIGETLLAFCESNIGEKKMSIQLMILAELMVKYEGCL